MKKMILILFAAIMTSCTCVMSQIPSQSLYVDQSCGAALPDYRLRMTFTDNCQIDTVEQTPTPGSWLTQRYNTVLIRAIDNFQNHTDVLFSVELIDTIGPALVRWDTTLITDAFEKISTLYNVADRMLAYEEMWFDANFDWAAAGIPDSLQPTNEYFNKVMLTWSSPGLAFGLPGSRIHTFVTPGDTLIIPPDF
jgi:hypothetical protein